MCLCAQFCVFLASQPSPHPPPCVAQLTLNCLSLLSAVVIKLSGKAWPVAFYGYLLFVSDVLDTLVKAPIFSFL